MMPRVQESGSWPTFNPNWDSSRFNWMKPAALSTLWKPRDDNNNFPRGSLIGVKPDRDFTDTSNYILYVGYTQDIDSPTYPLVKNNTAVYLNMAVKVLVKLGANISVALQDMKDVADFEQKLLEMILKKAKELQNVPTKFKENILTANLEPNQMNSQTMNEVFRKMRVADMKNLMGQDIDWQGFLNVVLNAVSTSIDENTEVRVACPDIMRAINDLFAVTPPRTIANYLMWKLLIDNFHDALPNFLEEIVYPDQPCRETIELEARNQHCLQQANVYMQKQAGRLYIDQYLDLQARSDDVMDLKDKIRDALKGQMEEADWMDKTTRQAAIDKLLKVTFSVGYSQDLMDDDLLNQLIGDGPYHHETYVENKIMAAHQTNTLWLTQYKKNGGILDKIRSIFSPISVNAAYLAKRNWIEVNAAFLHPPFYDSIYNNALKYGITGFIIGHELGHGFDSTGRQYDANGNLRDWWTKKSSENFNTRAQCMVDQYNNYKMEEVNRNVDGSLTLDDNIADNEGVKAAFKAYQLRNEQHGPEKRLAGLEKYSPEQLFFISYARFFCTNMDSDGILQALANEHSPNKIRVIGPLSNYDEFSKAYKCRPGSKYNPSKKCVVW